MAKDEDAALDILYKAMQDENVDLATRVNAAGLFLQWSTLESIHGCLRHMVPDYEP